MRDYEEHSSSSTPALSTFLGCQRDREDRDVEEAGANSSNSFPKYQSFSTVSAAVRNRFYHHICSFESTSFFSLNTFFEKGKIMSFLEQKSTITCPKKKAATKGNTMKNEIGLLNFIWIL